MYTYRDWNHNVLNEIKTMIVLLCCTQQRGVIPALVLTMCIDQVGQLEGGFWHMKWIYNMNKDKLKSVQKILNFEKLEQENYAETTDPGEQWPQTGKISVKGAAVRYRKNTPLVFKGVSFEVDPGFKVGVCGRAGAGKSTVSLTMARVLEIEEGTIEIDGVDISKVGLRRLRNKVTFIPQEACLFKRHLKYNLDPTGKISEDELRRITASSGLEELLRK